MRHPCSGDDRHPRLVVIRTPFRGCSHAFSRASTWKEDGSWRHCAAEWHWPASTVCRRPTQRRGWSRRAGVGGTVPRSGTGLSAQRVAGLHGDRGQPHSDEVWPPIDRGQMSCAPCRVRRATWEAICLLTWASHGGSGHSMLCRAEPLGAALSVEGGLERSEVCCSFEGGRDPRARRNLIEGVRTLERGVTFGRGGEDPRARRRWVRRCVSSKERLERLLSLNRP